MSTEEEKNLRRAERNLTRKGLVNELVDYEWEYEKGKLILKTSEDLRVFYGNQYYDLKVGLDFEERLFPTSPRRRSVSRDLLKTDEGLRERIPIFSTLYKSLYYGILLLGGIGLGNPVARKLISTDPIIASCMPMESANPVVTALEMGFPGLAATFGTGGTSRVVVRDESSGVFSLGNAPQRPVHVAALERQASEQHFFTESESVSSQENDESSADVSGGSSHSQSESEEETSAHLLTRASSLNPERNKPHKEISKEWLGEPSFDETVEEVMNCYNQPKKGPTKNKKLSKQHYVAIREALGLRNDPCTDLQGINPSDFTSLSKLDHVQDLGEFVPRTPFDSTNILERTPPGPFIAENILDRTPRVAESLTSQTSFTEGPVTSQEVSEVNPSNETSTQLEVDERSTIHLLSGKKKVKPLPYLGPNSKVVLNLGDKGVNTINTVMEDYRRSKPFNKGLVDRYGNELQKNNISQWDHTRGKVENSNLMAHSDSEQSYQEGPTVFTSSALHKAKGNERVAQEKRHLAYNPSSLEPNGPRFCIANNVTMLQASCLREVADINVIKATPQAEFDKFGVTRENTIQATRDVYALDRATIARFMIKLGLKNQSEYYNLSLVHNVNQICNIGNDKLATQIRALHANNEIEVVKSPSFIALVHGILSYNFDAKIFNESMCLLYGTGTQIDVHLNISRNSTIQSTNHLLRALEETGVNIGMLNQYNPSLEGGGPVSFSADKLTFTKFSKTELCKSKEEMDAIAVQLQAGVVVCQRHHIFPHSPVFEPLLQVCREEVSSSAAQPQLAISAGEPNSSAVQPQLAISAGEYAKKSSTLSASKRASRVQSASTTSRKTSSKAAPAKKNSQGAGNSKALTVRTPPKP